MADTVIDEGEPVPPTEDEARRPPAKRSAWRPVFLALGLLALVAGGVGLYLYFFKWRDTWTAHLHVPENASVAFRADGKQLWLYAPFREQVVAAVEAERGKEPDTAAKKLVRRIEAETGVDFSELRDVIVASVDAVSWVVIAAGKFPSSGVVEGFDRALAAEKITGYARDGNTLSFGKGLTVAQADDGTLIVATTASLALAALPASEGVRVPLPVKGAVSFLVNQRAWAGLLALIPPQIPLVGAANAVEQASGTLTLGDAPRLEIEIEPKAAAQLESLKKDFDLAQAGLRLLLTFSGPLYGARDAIRNATIEVKGGKLVLAGPWPPEGLDEACKRLADLIRTGGLSWLPTP
ncbi:MAG: hypothetical protein IT373_30430 [Polyangiaceae bacterium]|nr:hypothetical protein [Polyangiaceae bacterium]